MSNLILIAPADVIKSDIMGMWSHQSVLIDTVQSRKSTGLIKWRGWIITVVSTHIKCHRVWTREPIDSKEKKWSYIFSSPEMTCTSLPVGVQGVSDRTPHRHTVCVQNCYQIWGPCTAHPLTPGYHYYGIKAHSFHTCIFAGSQKCWYDWRVCIYSN